MCNVLSSDGNIIGTGAIEREEELTRAMVGLEGGSMNEIINVLCEEK